MTNDNNFQNNQTYDPFQGGNPQPGQPAPANPQDPYGQPMPVNQPGFYRQPVPANRQANPAQGQPYSPAAAPVSPEAGPVTEGAAENQPQQTEYGYDVIKKIESQAEQIERKEPKPQPQPQQPQQQGNKPAAGQQAPSAPVQPSPIKLFGYKISPLITNNFKLISNQKGRGDPASARTWIYVLLDRLLRKQTAAADK